MFSAISKGFAQLNLILMVFGVLSMVVPSALAQEVHLEELVRDMPKVKELPANKQLEWQTFNDVTTGLSVTARLPQDWMQDTDLQVSKDALSELLMTEILHFDGPARLDGVSTLSVQTQLLRPNYSLGQWFADFKRDQNFSLAGFQTPSDEKIEFFFVAIEKGVSKIYRGYAMRVDRMIVMALHTMPQTVWGQEQGVQKAVIEQISIAPQAVPRGIGNSDFMHNFKGLVSFLVPPSWVVIDRDIDGVDADNITLRRYSDAAARAIALGDDDVDIQDRDDASLVKVFYVEGSDEGGLSRVIRQVHRHYAGQGNRYNDEPFEYIDNMILGVGVRRGVIEVYNIDGVNSRNPDREHWLAVLQGRNGYALVSTIAPRRQDDNFAWGSLTRNVRQVAESLIFLTAE